MSIYQETCLNQIDASMKYVITHSSKKELQKGFWSKCLRTILATGALIGSNAIASTLPTGTDQTFTMAHDQTTLLGKLNTGIDPDGGTVTYTLDQNEAGLDSVSPDGSFTYTRGATDAPTNFGFRVHKLVGNTDLYTDHYLIAYIDVAPEPIIYDSAATRTGYLPQSIYQSFGDDAILSYELSALEYTAPGQQTPVSVNIINNVAQYQNKNILTLNRDTRAYTFSGQEPGVYDAHYHVTCTNEPNSPPYSRDAVISFIVNTPLGFIVNPNESLTVTSKISGAGPLVLKGGGTVSLQNSAENNDYTTATVIEGGIVLQTLCNQLGATGVPVHLKNGAIKTSGTWNRPIKIG
jgi:hypothetical protein